MSGVRGPREQDFRWPQFGSMRAISCQASAATRLDTSSSQEFGDWEPTDGGTSCHFVPWGIPLCSTEATLREPNAHAELWQSGRDTLSLVPQNERGAGLRKPS